MSTSGRIREHIRSNAIGYLALFVALTIAPTWAGALEGRDDPATATPSKAKAKAKKGPRGPAGPQGPQGPQGTQGPPGPLSGAAGGELAGTYPNPSIGTVSGLDIASSTSPTGGINFGADTNLYRGGSNSLQTDDILTVNAPFVANGIAIAQNGLNVSGNFVVTGSTDASFTTTYIQLPITTGAPVAADCDSAPEVGRTAYDPAADILYICDGVAWQNH